MSTSPNDGGAAFPVPPERTNVLSGGNVRWAYAHPGMTLRDYFAAAALQGMLASSSPGQFSEADYAGAAYAQAKAMLAERNKGAQS